MALRFSPARGAGAISISSYIRGPQGAAATIAVGTVTPLTPGATPTVSNSGSSSAAVLNFGIPTSKTVSVGTTTTANAGASAAVSDSGDANASVFDFTIPRGSDAGLKYSFETSTTMAAPATGGIRANNATIASATAFAVSANTADTGNPDESDYVITWDDSTNTIKGYLVIRKEGPGAALYIFRINSVVDNGTWLQINVTYVSGSGTLSASDRIYLSPNRVGDKGTDGVISGSTGATDNRVLRADGTGGATVQSSAVTIDDSGNVSGVGTLGTTGAISAGSTIELGHASDTTVSRASAGVIAVEGVNLTPNVPISSKSAAYTVVLGDANTAIYHPSTDNNARTFTIDSNANVAYPVGTCLTFINEINTVTIAITSDTLTLAGSGSTGSRSLAANGMATAIKVASTKWVISGTGLT